MRASIAVPMTVSEIELCVHAGIGDAMYPADGPDHKHLMQLADAAMYKDKNVSKEMLSDAVKRTGGLAV